MRLPEEYRLDLSAYTAGKRDFVLRPCRLDQILERHGFTPLHHFGRAVARNAKRTRGCWVDSKSVKTAWQAGASFLSKTRRFAFRKSRPFIVLGTGAARIPRTGETIAGAASLRVHRPETTFRNSVAVALLAVLASFVLGWLTSHSVDAFSGWVGGFLALGGCLRAGWVHLQLGHSQQGLLHALPEAG
jgi:hypothetical protein